MTDVKSQRTLRVTDEMVEQFYNAYRRNDWPVFSSVAPRIKEGLEAALEPHLERRWRERRMRDFCDKRASVDRRKPDPTPKGIGPQGVNGSAPHSAQEVGEDEFGEICRRAARYTYPRSSWMSDAEAQELYKAVEDRTKLIDMFCKSGLVTPTPSKQEQNKAPEIHVSERMVEAGKATYPASLPKDLETVALINEACRRIYRSMEAQRRKEQGQ